MWTFTDECTNEIAIMRDGVKVASVTSDNDSSPEYFKVAQFIVDACNAKERTEPQTPIDDGQC